MKTIYLLTDEGGDMLFGAYETLERANQELKNWSGSRNAVCPYEILEVPVNLPAKWPCVESVSYKF